jgi:thiamine pyrophosphate-dependent acetolactate synthase large subunit-like protein
LARSLGCKGISVQNPADLSEAFREAFASRAPTVIDVETSLDASFQDIVSPFAGS